MAWDDKTHRERVETIIRREGIADGTVTPKTPKPAKYRREHQHSPGKRPDLRPGARLIWSLSEKRGRFWGDRAGYALGVVLDYTGGGDGWYFSAEVIVQVIRVSKPKFEHMVGRLRHLMIHSYGLGDGFPRFVPDEANPADYGLTAAPSERHPEAP